MIVIVDGCEFIEERVGENVVFMVCSFCKCAVLWVPTNDIGRVPKRLSLHVRRCLTKER